MNVQYPTILIALPLALQDGADKYNGIMRFLKEHNLSWHIRLDRMSPSLIRPTVGEKNTFDGAIIDGSASAGLVRAYTPLRMPLVALDWRHPELGRNRRNLAYVDSDNAEIGRMAAKTLGSTSNYASFAYLSISHDISWSRARGDAFARALRRAGHDTVFLTLDKTLPAQLAALDKPAAVFAANDEAGASALNDCLRMNIAVPANLSVLGVDNELLTCQHSEPPLASIAPDFEAAGYLAAASLAAMLAHKPFKTHQLYHVKGVIPRQSMEASGTAGRLVQRAMQLIQDADADIPNVGELARRLGISRRLLDLRFHEIQSCSVLDALTNVRMEKVCTLLESTNMPITDICAASNLGTGTYPCRAFRKRFGMTMSAYRASHRKGKPI